MYSIKDLRLASGGLELSALFWINRLENDLFFIFYIIIICWLFFLLVVGPSNQVFRWLLGCLRSVFSIFWTFPCGSGCLFHICCCASQGLITQRIKSRRAKEIYIQCTAESPLNHRPDMTFTVDWALKYNYLSIPLKSISPSTAVVTLPSALFSHTQTPCTGDWNATLSWEIIFAWYINTLESSVENRSSIGLHL